MMVLRTQLYAPLPDGWVETIPGLQKTMPQVKMLRTQGWLENPCETSNIIFTA